MVTLEERVELAADADAVFEFLSDFRNLPKWDPGIGHCRRTSGDGSTGTAYEVGIVFMGRKSEMRYETRSYDRTAREAVIVGEGKGIEAVDRIRVEPRVGGCTVVWNADFLLSGVAGRFDWMSKPFFLRLGNKAMNGLRRYAASSPFAATNSSTSAHSA